MYESIVLISHCLCFAHSLRGRAHFGILSGRSPLGGGLADQSTALDAFQRSGIQSHLLGLLHWIRAFRDDPFALYGYCLLANWRFAKGIVVGDIVHYLELGDLLRDSHIFELPIFLYCAGRIFWRDCRLSHSRSVACSLDIITNIKPTDAANGAPLCVLVQNGYNLQHAGNALPRAVADLVLDAQFTWTQKINQRRALFSFLEGIRRTRRRDYWNVLRRTVSCFARSP